VYGASGAVCIGSTIESPSMFREDRLYDLSTRGLLRAGGRLLCVVLAGGLPAFAQSASAPASQAELDAKVRMLSQTLEETRLELSESRSEIGSSGQCLNKCCGKWGSLPNLRPVPWLVENSQPKSPWKLSRGETKR